MTHAFEPERCRTVVVGAGQAGLSVGYHLQRLGVPFVILDANERIGDSWRQRWDSLRLFSPARYDGLDGMPFPGRDFAFPTKDQMADYLEAYAARFRLPVRTGVRVTRVGRQGRRYVVESGNRRIEADDVVIAMSTFQRPAVPSFAGEIDAGVVQLHSSEYRNPAQLCEGPVLIVGAGNSGAEIAVEVARRHRHVLAGRDVGRLPFRIEGTASRLLLWRLVLRLAFHHLLTVSTPLGRRLRPRVLSIGGPLIRTRPRDLTRAGIECAPRVVGTRDGRPLLADGRVFDAANVIWCTGFHPGFSWIDLPVFDPNGLPRHERGIVPSQPGLYFVGLHFLYALSSTMIHGVGRDARRIARAIRARTGAAPRRQRVKEVQEAAMN